MHSHTEVLPQQAGTDVCTADKYMAAGHMHAQRSQAGEHRHDQPHGPPYAQACTSSQTRAQCAVSDMRSAVRHPACTDDLWQHGSMLDHVRLEDSGASLPAGHIIIIILKHHPHNHCKPSAVVHVCVLVAGGAGAHEWRMCCGVVEC